MRKVAIGAALLLGSCGPQPDSNICLKVSAPEAPAGRSVQFNEEWQRQNAEACVHRQAYRLAKSGDPAQTVADAVVEACESEIGTATMFIHGRTFRESLAPDIQTKVKEAEADQKRAEASYRSLALLKVVEGRAGHCRPL